MLNSTFVDCGDYSNEFGASDFSLCFEDSVLSWGICILCILISIVYMALGSYSIYSYGYIRPMFILTLIGAFGSLIPQIIILVESHSDSVNAPVLMWNSIIIFITTLLIVFVICYERTKGNVSILPVWVFWALMSICSGIKLRTILRGETLAQIESLSKALPILFYVYFAFCVLNLILHSIRELPIEKLTKKQDTTEMDETHKMKYDRSEIETRKSCPSEYATFINVISFHWLTRIVWKGYKHPLEDKDLYQVPHDSQTKQILDHFFLAWTRGIRCPKGTTSCKNNRSLVYSLALFNWKSILASVGCKLANDILTFVPPMILKQLIYYNANYQNLPKSYGLTYCALLIGSLVLQTVFIQSYFDQAINTGMKIRVAVVAAIYRKALLLNNAGQKSSQLGQMTNLMQVDAQRLQDMMTYMNMLWSAPLQICIAMVLLYQELQESTFVGLSVTVLMLPLNSWLMTRLQNYQRIITTITDERVRKTDEVLNGIKVIKLYGWEASFTDAVEEIRGRELSAMQSRVKYGVVMTFIWSCSPILVALFSFLCYSLLGNTLTSDKTFVSLTLFNILRFPLIMLPNMISQLIQARVSINRINDFLALPELEPAAKKSENVYDDSNDVTIKNGVFSWDKTQTENKETLSGINIEIPRGKLVAIVGAVGAGKSSLISAILGEMDKLEGEVYLNGSVSYVPQVSWVLNDTLKNNILFGSPWDKCYYKEVIVNCALESDLQILPNGDNTEIGEKGINLSGGQKQRVSLARAIYNKNDIYIFDDPLSAVDSHVGKHLFDKVLGPDGMINNKTRILVTHKLSVLPEVDHVIVIKEGKVLEQGKYTELMSQDGELHRIVSSYEPEKDHVEEQEEDLTEDGDDVPAMVAVDGTVVPRRHSSYKRQESTCSIKGNRNKEVDEQLIAEEKMEKGKIKWTVYRDYMMYMGVFYSTITIVSFFAQYGCMLASSLWLEEWANANDKVAKNNGVMSSTELMKWLGGYAVFGIGQAVFVFTFVIAMLYASIKASRQIHMSMFSRILRVPMSFFDTTPLGRILNRFSKDMNTIDEKLPQAFRSFINILGTVFFTIIIIGVAIPIMLPVFLPITFLYLGVQKLYIPTSRQLKRLESVSRSPIFNQFGETLQGLSSIRAYSKSETFIRYNEGLVDDNVRSYYINMMSNRWLSTRLEIIGHFVIFFTALTAVLQAGTISASKAGLAISYAMGVTQALAWVVRLFSELETNVVSIERANEYSELTTERELVSDKPPEATWPAQGAITYKNVSVRYREGLDLVLKKLDIDIKPGERIGIVGRTGAGKSSITLTLFRILELAEGSITIDGIDIGSIGLHELRKSVSIIPQDPILFSDTIRKNLDPFDAYTDEQLWAALENASLKAYFSDREKKLEFLIQEGGSNLSVGQRQLVCLSRALLSDNKIIVMDEATAAVDIETDSVIQDAIRQTFAGRTILTIAHRLNTILDYDRILVLDKGEIAEFGTAVELKKKQGIFHSMLMDAGLLQAVPDRSPGSSPSSSQVVE